MRVELVALLAFGLAVIGHAQQPPAQSRPASPPPPPPAVKVGQAAPDFTLTYLAVGSDQKVQQKQVKLSDFKGQKNVVLAFFPAAFSPG